MLKKMLFATLILLSMFNLNGCGGGGSSAPAVEAPPVDHWISRAGASQSVFFKSYTTVMSGAIAVSDCSGGSLLVGREVAGDKGVQLRLDADGNEIWKQLIVMPFRNSFVAEDLSCSFGDVNFPMVQKRSPYGDWYLSVTQLSDGASVSDQIGINGPVPILENPWKVESAKALSDGNFILSARIYADGRSRIYYQDLDRANPDLDVEPPILPKHVAIDFDGIIIADDNHYMKYARDLTVLQQPTTWSTATDAKIHSIKTDGARTIIVGVENGNLKVSDPEILAFRCAKAIPVGSDKIQSAFADDGRFLVSVGNRIGSISLITGEMLTSDPPAILDAPWYTSGEKVISVVGGQELYVLPTSEILDR
jgi:hypothetical protein